MRALAVSDVRATLRALLDEIAQTHERVVITRNGTPAAVLMALDDLASLMETVDVLSDADLAAGIRQGRADLASGRVHTTDEVLVVLQSAGGTA